MTASPHILMVRATRLAQSNNVVTLANHLARSGFKLTIVCLTGAPDPVEGLAPEIEVLGLGCPLAAGGLDKVCQRALTALRLRRVLAARRFDALYVVDSWTLPVVWLATGTRFRWRRAGLVYHTFDWLEPALNPAWWPALERAVCRAADLVVNTDRSRARLQRSFYRLPVTPLWVQNGLPREAPIPAPDTATRRQLLGGRTTPDARLLIYPTVVSNPASAERLTYPLIQAFALLPDNYCLATFFRAGPEYERCLAWVKNSGLEARVTFLAPVSFSRLMAYLVCADLGAVLYDDRHSAGYFMANADKLSLLIACGLPFVASDYPNLESVTYRHGLGICCDGRDPVQLAQAIRELADGPVPLAERRQHVRQVFETHLNFDRQGPKLVAALRAVLDRKPVNQQSLAPESDNSNHYETR